MRRQRLTAHGAVPFRPGVGMIVSRLDVPVVPVRLEEVDQVLYRTWHMARPRHVRVTFGARMRLGGADYESLARQAEEAVRALAFTSSSDTQTTQPQVSS